MKKNYNTLEIIREEFSKEQKKHPFDPVTKNQVYSRIRAAFRNNVRLINEPLFSYRTMERKIDELCANKVVKKDHHGLYWLMKNWEKNIAIQQKANQDAKREIQFLKHQLRELTKEKNYFSGGYRIGQPYIEALIYCKSEEDWELLRAWFTKMNQNKYEQEQVEAWDADQEEIAEIEEQIKKEKK